MGPIAKWWVDRQVLVTLSTEIGDYLLMDPTEEYAPFMRTIDGWSKTQKAEKKNTTHSNVTIESVQDLLDSLPFNQ